MSVDEKIENKHPANTQLPSRERRRFLNNVFNVTAAGLASSAVGAISLSTATAAAAEEIGPVIGDKRQNQAFEFRKDTAHFYKNLPLPRHPDNGDDLLYRNKIASYSKGMPHNHLGEVDPNAYATYIHALETGSFADFEAVPHPGGMTQRDPQLSYTFELLGADSHSFAIRPAPTFNSAEIAGEMVELYWQGLTRDVLFAEYDSHPLTLAAADELSRLSDFRGAKQGGRVTPATLFRAEFPGCLTGPYISQFLLLPISYGPMPVSHRIQTSFPGAAYVTTYDVWLNQQNGFVSGNPIFDPVLRHLYRGRDLAEYVGRDVMYQAYIDAMLILIRGFAAPFAPSNPYNTSRTMHGHGTFGSHNILDLIARAASIAQKHAWYHKWLVHRRLRPAAFGGRVHNHVTGATRYPIHADVLNSVALGQIFSIYGTYLLPQVFPTGSPPHPAYPAGHPAIAGACVTILKAFFDESFVLTNAKVPSADGTALVPFTGSEVLTVGGELNKLAANISLGRGAAGVHWRSDIIEGMLLGEAAAISILRDVHHSYSEPFSGFTFTKFDGTQTVI
jgi:hypothetical protein